MLTPLDEGGTRHEPDGLLVVDDAGRIAFAGAAEERPGEAATAIDLRPWILLPGMVDMHAHLPQLPNAGLGAGLDLLTWLDRYIFPLERGFDEAAVRRETIEERGKDAGPVLREVSRLPRRLGYHLGPE